MGAGNIGVVPIPAPGCSPCWLLLLLLPLLLLPLLFLPSGTTTTTTTTTPPPVIPETPPPEVPTPPADDQCCIDLCNCAPDGTQCDDDCGSKKCTDFDDCAEQGICITGTPECEPTQGPKGICRIYGDPHVQTFDGQHASFYSVGEYWIVKSSTVQIQGRYLPTPVTNGLAVNKEIIIGGPFLQDHKLRISALGASYDGTPIITGFPDSWENANPSIKVTTDSSGELLQQGRAGKAMHVVHVSLPLGVELQINRWNEPGEGDYLNTKITMSAQPNQDGHCGNFNGNPADDTRPMIRSRIGTTGVPPGELLFPEPKTPVAPANRPDLNNCPPDQTEHAKTVCERKSHNGIASKECMIDVCFGGDTFADEDADNY
jgi:hypothetical protein